MRLSLLPVLPLVLASPVMQKRAALAPLIVPTDAEPIEGQYIVKLRDDVSSASADETTNSVQTTHVYQETFRGFAGTFNSSTVDSLRRDENVEYVEQDAFSKASVVTQQPNAPWGLVRISHRQKGQQGYLFDNSAGAGACAYVLDTGIDDKLPEFGGRAKQLRSFINGEGTDLNGHGTHVAGTIGSNTYGVAKRALVFGVKVLSNAGSGANSGIIAGMDFVVADKKGRTQTCPRGFLVNMSLGGGYSASINNAAAGLVKNGIFTGVAAGNDNKDASNVSPASEPTVCTVAASNISDSKAYFSNFGPPVDVWAPGENIISTWPSALGRPNNVNTISGTSMATPHVVGLAAYFLGLGASNGQQLCNVIQNIASKNIIVGVPPKTVNNLVFNNV